MKNFVDKFLQSMTTFDAYYKEGIEYYKAGQYREALECFHRALEKKDVKIEIYSTLGLVYQKLQRNEDAIDAYEKYAEVYSDDFDVIYNLAFLYYEKGDYFNAIECLEMVLQKQCTDVILFTLIEAYLKFDDIDKVLLLGEKIFKSKFVEKYYCKIAERLLDIGEKEDKTDFIAYSLNMFLSYLTKFSDNIEVYTAISKCYFLLKDIDKSALYCQKALNIDENCFDAIYQMGSIYYELDDDENAIMYLEKAIEQDSQTQYKAYLKLADVYKKQYEIEKAKKALTTIIRKFPNCPEEKEVRKRLNHLTKR